MVKLFCGFVASTWRVVFNLQAPCSGLESSEWIYYFPSLKHWKTRTALVY